jgi:GDPmannose 4,6-dehydratase
MWLMLQQEKPDDYVLATGETHSVREFVELAFSEAGIRIIWKGKNVEEKGYDAKTGRILVEINPRYFRPTEVEYLKGNPLKAEKVLGWKRRVDFKELVKMMMASDINEVMGGTFEEAAVNAES